jgi:hypothetical protein
MMPTGFFIWFCVNSTELLPCSSTHIDSTEIIKVEGREEAQPDREEEEERRKRGGKERKAHPGLGKKKKERS